MREKSPNWGRNCWKKLDIWRRGRRKQWELLPAAQQTIFRTCRINSSVSMLRSNQITACRFQIIFRKQNALVFGWDCHLVLHKNISCFEGQQLNFQQRHSERRIRVKVSVPFFPALQKRLTALPPTLRSMKTDYASLRSQVRNFSEFYGSAINEAKKQVCNFTQTLKVELIKRTCWAKF